ncbi:MAG: GGDEF domain-containing protein [Bacilli bacterium]|nr:GGDEF domain-containing protein [Bacilli bacterium]
MKKKLFIIVPVIVAILVFFGLYIYLNYEDDVTSLTVLEKKWIEENKASKINLEVVNDIPIYSSNGEGVIFNFIEDFQKDTDMSFNMIPYMKDSASTGNDYKIRILSNETNLTKNDILLFEDGYIAISKNEVRYNDITDFNNLVIGVFSEDVGDLSYYLKTGKDLTFKTYANITEMITALNDGTLETIIIPQTLYLDEVLGSNYFINYYFTEMNKKVVLTLKDGNTKLNTIVKKYYNNWKKNKYVEEYNEAYLSYYVKMKDISDKKEADLIGKTYTYGYVENPPYEVTNDDVVSGIAGEYISRIKRLTNIEVKYKKYKNLNELKKAISNKEVDIYFDYYNYDNENYTSTTSTFIEKYVILTKKESGTTVNSFESLKNQKVSILSNNILFNYFEDNSKAKLNNVSKINDLTKDTDIIVVDNELYSYYNSSKFKNYELAYSNYITKDYEFKINKENDDFYELFNYIITTNSYYNYRNLGLSSINLSLIEKTTFQELYLIVLAAVLTPMVIAGLVIFMLNNKKKIKEVKKEDRRKYTDILTSLKNRNYLNVSMPKWDENKVYPQAIAVVDLNNVKYVNDNYGHEKGDSLIVAAASVLVNTQLENSEIIRTDGNEFLIYLVGYSEKQTETYTKKLTKELKNLPYGFGAAIGYSMIMDDIKTIDDAINEAVLDMRTNKEENK